MRIGQGSRRSTATVAVPLGLIAFALGTAIVLRSGTEQYPHRLSVTVREATNVVPGQAIRLSGTQVGKITALEPIDGGRAAKLELLFDDRAWPLKVGTRMEMRWGGTVSFSNRYVALYPADKPGATYADGDRFPTRSFALPVEFDALLRTFDGKTRADFSDFLQQAGAAVDRAKVDLRAALTVTPPALTEASFVLRDIEEQQAAVATIVRSGSRVLVAVDASAPDVKALISGAGGTLDVVADEADALKRGLKMAPATFANVRDTLKRADPTLSAVRELTARIARGVTELRKTTQPLDQVLRSVRTVGPDARATLASLRRAAPDLNPLLSKATTLSPTLQNISKQAVENLKCIRPYSPDIIAFFTNWGDFFSAPDTKDKMIRAQVQNYIPAGTNAMSYTSGEAKKVFPGMEFGFPRPPGTNAGQPWFLPDCGAGPDALDPAKDPEARWSGMQPPTLRALVPLKKESK